MTNDHVGAWASAIWWHWGHFLTLRQWLHILHVAGSFIFTITEFLINSHITHYIHISQRNVPSRYPFSYFQHQFRISYRIILREKELHLNIGVYNPSKVTTRYLGGFFTNKGKIWSHSQETPFDFNVLLHSYFKCPDVRRCQVGNLQMRTFFSTFQMRIIFSSFSKLQPSPTQVTGLNGVNFLDRTRTPLEGPHPGLPPQVYSASQFLLQTSAQNK